MLPVVLGPGSISDYLGTFWKITIPGLHSQILFFQFSSVQSLSCVWLFATPWIAAHQASLSITNSRSSLRPIHRVSDAIQPSHLLSSPSPPAPNPSQHQSLFQWVNSSHEVAKVAQSCPTLCDPLDCSTPGFPVLNCSQILLKFMSIELVMLFNYLILCHLLLLLPSIFPRIRVFSNVSVLCIRWPKYCSFSFS